MKLFFQYLKQYKGKLAACLLLATVNQVFSLLDPQIFRILIDRYANKVDTLSTTDYLTGVTLLLLATMFVALVSRIAKNFQDYYTSLISQKSGGSMYQEAIAKSLRMPFAVFEDQRSGEILSKIEGAKSKSQNFLGQFINVFFIPIVGIVFVLSYAFFVHWSIGLAYIIMLPTIGYITYLTSKSIKAFQKEIVRQTSDLAGSSTETLRNVEIVKALGLEDEEITRLSEANEKIILLELQKIKKTRMMSFIQGTMINTLRTALMFLMLYLMMTKAVSLGEFFSLLFYSFFLFNPLTELGNLAINYQETKGSLEKLDEALKIEPEKTPANPKDIKNVQTIEAKDLSFSYQDGTKVLKNLTFKLEAGKTYAFAGPSGSGKTTIIKLLIKLYTHTSGKLLINDHNIEDISNTDLRKKLSLVTQDNQIFSGTLRNNLLFVRKDASEQEMLEAITQSESQSLIEKSKNGLDTVIGENGIKLSGGEKQRLSIARSLLRNPEILILDEATSSLDSITEEAITNTIKSLRSKRPNMIIIMIAHRLSTIKHSDKIFIMEKGTIAEEGNHDTLLSQKGLYYALWRQQS